MKRIIYTLACLLLSVGAWAQTLQEQINAAGTTVTTITLSADADEALVIPEGADITIDLNGHNIVVATAKAAFTNNGTLKIIGNGNVSRADLMGYVVENHGTIELAGGNYKKTAGTSRNALLGNYGTMKISGGTYYAKYKNDVSADNIYSQRSNDNATLEMTGGEFLTNTSGFVSDVIVKGGTFVTAPLTKFFADGYGVEKNAEGKYVASDGFVVVDSKSNFYNSLETAFITATTYLSLIADISGDVTIPESATTNYLYLNNHKIDGNITNNATKTLILGESSTAKATSENGIVTGTITGNVQVVSGKYSNDPVAFVDKYVYKTEKVGSYYVVVDKTADEKAAALAADGIVATTGSGSSAAYFTSIQNAWNASTSTTSCQISLVADVTEDVTRVKASAPIFKLEGHNFTGKMDTRIEGASKYFTINGAGTATLTEVYCGNMTIDNNANVIIEGGNVTGTLTVKAGSTLTIKGGTFANDPTAYVAADYKVIDNGNGTYTVMPINSVAQIGTKKYESLAEAIEAAQNGETVTLLADATENIVVPADKNITLDLNGKTLSGGSVASNGKKAAIVNNGTITIQDSSAEQTGTIKREDDDTGLTKSNSYYVIDNQGTMTIKSGTITNNAGLTTSHKGSSLIRNGEVAEGAVLNIEGGTLTQDNFDVIKNGGNNSVLNITGGTINSANSYAILSYDKVNMSAGTVTGKVCLRSYDSDYAVANISGGTINGNITVETYPGNTPVKHSECNISGTAVINGTLSIGEGNGNTFTANEENGTIAVSGGTFNNAVPEKYCADGFIPTDDGEGHYGVKNGSYVAQIGDVKYDTLAAAIAAAIAAAEDGTETTITLITDVIENITVPAGKKIILDLNDKTLNGKQTASSPTIKNLGTLTVKNGNVRRTGDGSASWYIVENEGTITMDEGLNVEGSANSSLIRNNAVDAQMTFNAGTYTQTGAFIVVKNDLGNVVINGGTFTTADNKNVLNNWDQMTINGGTFTGNIFNGAYDTDNNKLTINDGTFNTAKISTYIGNGKTTCPIEIKGGKFTNPDMTYAATGEDNAQVAVSGGTFANPVPEKYCAEDFIPKDNGDGTYGVKEGAYIARIGEQGYETLDAAIEAAKQEESATTITLLADAETTKETLPANVTIDVNEKVLTMPSFVVLDGEAYTLPKITGAETYKVKKATYIRTNISATEWGTVCLPFSLTSGNGATYYTFNNINGSTLTVDEVATVDPHTPVVFQKAAGDLEINEANATVSLVTPENLENGALVGTYTDANITADGNIYFINGDTFHKAQVSVKVPMYRAYIYYTASGAKPDVLNLNVIGIGNADGIESVVMDATNTAEAIYDVNGRQLTAPQKGLNIMKLANGKTVKVMLK